MKTIELDLKEINRKFNKKIKEEKKYRTVYLNKQKQKH